MGCMDFALNYKFLFPPHLNKLLPNPHALSPSSLLHLLILINPSFSSLSLIYCRIGSAIVVTVQRSPLAFSELIYNPQCFLLHENSSIAPDKWDDVSWGGGRGQGGWRKGRGRGRGRGRKSKVRGKGEGRVRRKSF